MIDAHAHLPSKSWEKSVFMLEEAGLSGIKAVLLNASGGKDEKEFERLASLACLRQENGKEKDSYSLLTPKEGEAGNLTSPAQVFFQKPYGEKCFSFSNSFSLEGETETEAREERRRKKEKGPCPESFLLNQETKGAFQKGVSSSCSFVSLEITGNENKDNPYFPEKQKAKVFAAVGFHPFAAEKIRPEDFDFLEAFLASHPSLGVGEIGLDKTKPFFEKQLLVFERQLQIAKNLRRFVCIHNVKALGEMQGFYKRRLFPEKVLFHRFEGAFQTACFLLDKGAFLSLREPKEKWRSLPKERFLLETDSPGFYESFLSIPRVYRQAADRMGLDAGRIEKNFEEFIYGK